MKPILRRFKLPENTKAHKVTVPDAFILVAEAINVNRDLAIDNNKLIAATDRLVMVLCLLVAVDVIMRLIG